MRGNRAGKQSLPSCSLIHADHLFYVLECIDLWLYPPDEECGLTLFRVLDVIDAWLYPVESD